MSGLSRLIQLYQFFHMFESHHQQRLAWEDAAQARIARERAERMAASQLAAMLEANPSGQLGASTLNDVDALTKGGLL